MRSFCALVVFTVLASFVSFGQRPEEALGKLVRDNPVEKIHLHFDRGSYTAGQTIWFKAYLYSDFLPSTKSTDLFIEISNSGSGIIERLALPVFGGFAHGQIELPDTLTQGTYLIRAYTATMLNYDAGFVYHKAFFIAGKTRKERVLPTTSKEIRLEFFPEGGNLISDLSNSVAFKATDANGLPIAASGSLYDGSNNKLEEFSSIHDGMGYFDLTTSGNNSYYVVLNGDSARKKYNLPPLTTKGVVFRVISAGATKTFEILQRPGDAQFKAAFMIGQMQHRLVFRKSFSGVDDDITGIIPTEKLSSGILHLTVFNKDGLPLAERLTFIDNKEYLEKAELITDTLSFSNKGKNHFTLQLSDSAQGSFSVSVTDAATELETRRSETIVSALLLTGDLKGYIHDPAYYFSSNDDSVQGALDLVMMTNGWRRFRWDSIHAAASRKYADPAFITLSGRINLESTRKPFADKDLLLFVMSANSGKNMLLLHTDAQGHFSIDSAVFFGNARVLFTDIKGKKSRFIDVKLDGDSLYRPYALPVPAKAEYARPILAADAEKKLFDQYKAIRDAEGVLLEGVTVKVRKKTPLEETEEKYVSGLFVGDANSTVDLTNENLTGYPNIFDYLQMRIPGVQILKDPEGSGYIIEYRQTASVSGMGEIPMTIFLNEIPSDADAVSSIPAYEIALVKVYSSFVGAPGNAPGGVMAIYTKKGADLTNAQPTAGEMISYRGYSVIKEFYSPNYSEPSNTSKADHRLTLLWNPSVIASGVNVRLPITFYNNDHARQFKVVVEGVTADGKLLLIEKNIGARAF